MLILKNQKTYFVKNHHYKTHITSIPTFQIKADINIRIKCIFSIATQIEQSDDMTRLISS
jgi:hypothetical protein